MQPYRGRCFFVVGYGRSGTTLLRKMLSAHPNLFVPPENDIFQRLTPRLGKVIADPAALERMIGEFPPYYSRIYDVDLFRARLLPRLPAPLPEAFATLIGSALIAADKSDAIWGHKRPSEWTYLSTFRQWFPDAVYLHVVRHPQDSIASMVHHQLQSYPTTALVGAWQWRRAFRELRRQAERLGPDRYAMIRYEDLVDDAAGQLARACDLIGVTRDAIDRMIDFHEDASASHVDPQVHMKHSEGRLTRDRVGAGASQFTDRQSALIDHLTRKEMAELGYAPRASHAPGAARRAALALSCRGLDLAWTGLRASRRLRGQP